MKFITGRVGMYYSFFIISPLLFVGAILLLHIQEDFWHLLSVNTYATLELPLHLFTLLLVPIIATAGVVGSVVRTIASKDVGIIHKIVGVSFFLVVLFCWLFYVSLVIYD